MSGFFNADTTDAGGKLTEEALFKAMKAIMRSPESPPVVSRFHASHSVPFGRVYRMWTTRGELIAYVNRGLIADLPRAPEPWDFIGVSSMVPPGLLGIPVYYD